LINLLHLLHIITFANTVDHLVAGLLLIHIFAISLNQGSKSLRLTLFELDVFGLLLSNFFQELLNLVVLHLKLTLFNGGLCPLSLGLDLVSRLNHLDVFLVVVLLLLEIIDLFNEFNILLHEALVYFLVRLVSLGQRTSQVVNILLQILA
jgi:hypothetical protein